MSVSLKAVAGSRTLRDFIDVPWAIYAGDPAWVPPLKLERRQALAPKHPFFEHADWRAWVAYRDGLPIGRISAQIDRLHQEQYHDHTGYFGLLEIPEDPAVAKALFETAEGWLAQRGMRRAVGPFSLGINQEIGLLVQGFETPPYVMMGHARPHYGALVEALGYAPVKDVLAYEVHRDWLDWTRMRELVKRLPADTRIRPFDKRRADHELEMLRAIFNDAWANNWGFVPFTGAEFRAVGREMLALLPGDFIQVAELGGEPVAFIALLPNVNEAIADLNGRLLPFGWLKLLWRLKVRLPKTGRVALMGVRRRLQRTRIGPLLAIAVIDAVSRAAVQRGIERVELSWILEDNRATRHIIETIGSRMTKRYRMYEKPIQAIA
jgi:hypothetical protein